MALQKKVEGDREKCEACGKPLYRPRACRRCGKKFCRDHLSSRKHECVGATTGGLHAPSRRLATIIILICCVAAASVLFVLVWSPRESGNMTGIGKRGMVIGPYLQYFRVDLKDSEKLSGLAVNQFLAVGNEIWAGTSNGVNRLHGRAWRQEGLEGIDVYSLSEKGDALICGNSDGVHELSDGTWQRVTGSPPGVRTISVLGDAEGRIWVGTEDGVGLIDEGQWRTYPETVGLSVKSLASLNGVKFAGTGSGLWRLDGDRWLNVTEHSGLMSLPSADVRSILASDGDLWVCTGSGLALFDGVDYYYTFTGQNGLPYEDTRCAAVGANGTVFVGTGIGVCELRDGRWHYYQGPRWMSNDIVNSVAVDDQDSIWLGTANGVSKIRGEWIFLEEKARMINEVVEKRHFRDGYIEFINLREAGDFSSNWTYHASDNDGLWTSIYLAAESFRYAVTGDPKAKANARECYQAMRRLEELTGITGFPARAAVRKGDTSVVKSGGEWHVSSIDPSWEWKGDTSSDEIDGHYFAYAIYYDLVADEAERKDVAALVSRITDHIIGHDYYLVDLDGKPTRWGVWNPREINDDTKWAEEHGLNALEILSHIKVAIHMTGQERFIRAYEELIEQHHYHLNTISQKILPPGHVNHSDDELAFLAYYPLLIYEDDPRLRAVYLKSIERSWQIERPERSPFFNFVYGAATGADFDLEESIEELRGMSPDLLDWTVMNSHRSDVRARMDAGELFTLPFENRNMRRWNAGPHNLDWVGSGSSEGDGAYYLMPYWMGRYHGFIIEG